MLLSSRTLLPELQRKWFLLIILYEQFNEKEPEQQGSVTSDGTELWYIQFRYLMLLDSMRCVATLLGKTIFKKCCVVDRNISLVRLDWTDGLNFIRFPDENKTCQTPTLEPTNAKNLARGYSQCLCVAEIPHPLIYIQSPKADSSRTQL
ncbi:unnamed protein product [Hymenolepis diminuta]|uniref:Uncharacterized protein n=1 Tax=Hymenolepis diminuta TaxID=6216 RepID=A0A564Z909_HYMDI|nr:unnamed protein product [Hymenolepis diminuta]